jgi:hypothetical protein
MNVMLLCIVVPKYLKLVTFSRDLLAVALVTTRNIARNFYSSPRSSYERLALALFDGSFQGHLAWNVMAVDNEF